MLIVSPDGYWPTVGWLPGNRPSARLQSRENYRDMGKEDVMRSRAGVGDVLVAGLG
jgi:hypothetical protein